MTWLLALGLAGFAAAGFALGLVYFRLLERNVELYVRGCRARGAALHGVRMIAAIALFFGAALAGASAALSALAGFLIARRVAVRRAR